MLTTKNTVMSKKVKPRDTVTVYGTGASKFMAANKDYVVHANAADNLIAKGFATKEKTTDSKPSKTAQK